MDTNSSSSLFAKRNYIWMLIGFITIAVGMLLMAGGKSNDPNTFDTNKIYSTTRITIAPIVILIGLCIEVYAIFTKPKSITQ